MFEGLRFYHWRTASDKDGVVTLTLDRAEAKVNALSREVLDELAEIIERIAINKPQGVVICSGKADSFVVGADIKEFQGFAAAGTIRDAIEHGQRVFQDLARLPCPTVAAIHGTCLGGGTELALACDMRVASDDRATRIGLPEVQLGIHPGWGGTARLPRLVGAPEAMKLMLAGAPISANQAAGIGLVDRVVSAETLLERACKLARKPRQRPLQQRLLAWVTNLWPVRQALAPVLVKQTSAKVRKEHYPAPFALIEVWRRGGGSIRQRLKLETRSVTKLAASDTARNLIRVFFLQERLKGLGRGTEHGVEHVHVIGAGVMGGDIAAWCAYKDFTVSLEDREMKYITPALKRARELFEKKSRGDTTRADAIAKRLSADVEGEKVASADLVIEAIFENSEAKQELYRNAEPKMREDAMLASNTSSIPLLELSKTLKRPGHFLGLHYFNPVAKMPLVEIVRHPQLDKSVEKRALAFVRAIDKLPVPVKGTPGFLVNRILVPYLLEAIRAMAEGVPGAVLDKAARKFGMPMGPIELADTVGLDVCASVGKELAEFLGVDLPEGVEPLIEAGTRGKKDGKGFYVWEGGKPQKPDVPEGYQPPTDLTDRLILPMLNEAVACLDERVVEDPELLDAGVIFGTGFAPFRGGPIQYIRDTGVDAIKARLDALAATHGERFKPKAGWNQKALQPE